MKIINISYNSCIVKCIVDRGATRVMPGPALKLQYTLTISYIGCHIEKGNQGWPGPT